MRRIEYRKHFISGPLTGISVGEFFNADVKLAGAYVSALNGYTQLQPGQDTITGDKFWISRVSVEPVKFEALAA